MSENKSVEYSEFIAALRLVNPRFTVDIQYFASAFKLANKEYFWALDLPLFAEYLRASRVKIPACDNSKINSLEAFKKELGALSPTLLKSVNFGVSSDLIPCLIGINSFPFEVWNVAAIPSTKQAKRDFPDLLEAYWLGASNAIERAQLDEIKRKKAARE